MVFSEGNNLSSEHFEEEEEGGIDDELLGELDDDVLEDELEDELEPVLKPVEPDPLLADEEDVKDGTKFFDDEEEDEEDMDYDSFDDKDEL